MYEGYGPDGVAFLVECLTDNRNRAASDVRLGFTLTTGTALWPTPVRCPICSRVAASIEVPAAEGVDFEESIR